VVELHQRCVFKEVSGAQGLQIRGMERAPPRFEHDTALITAHLTPYALWHDAPGKEGPVIECAACVVASDEGAAGGRGCNGEGKGSRGASELRGCGPGLSREGHSWVARSQEVQSHPHQAAVECECHAELWRRGTGGERESERIPLRDARALQGGTG